MVLFMMADDSARSRRLEEYLKEIADDNMASLRLLYEETSAGVYSFTLSMLKNREDAEDAVQDTLLRLWRLRDALPTEGLEAYATRVAKNVCIDLWRRQQQAPQDLNDIEEPLHSDTPLGRMEARETEQRLARLIKQLPERHRLLLRMRHEDGLQTDEISRLTGIPSRSVSAMISEAKARLRKAMNQDI